MADNRGHSASEGDAAATVTSSEGTGGSAGRSGSVHGDGGKAHDGSGGEPSSRDDGSLGPNPSGGSSSGTLDAGAGGAATQPDPGGARGTCSDIVSCVQACADDACAQKCPDQGSPTAADLFNALLACADQNGCSDGACLRMNCAAEADACTGDRPSSGSKDAGAAPTGGGALPAELVGTWANSDESLTYQFNADGTYKYVFHYGSSLTCIAYLSQRITEVGNVSVQGDTLTTMGTSRTTETQNCNYSSSTEMDSGKTQSYRYALSGSTLSLTDSSGNPSVLMMQ